MIYALEFTDEIEELTETQGKRYGVEECFFDGMIF